MRVVEFDDHLRVPAATLAFVAFGDEDGAASCAHPWLASSEAACARGLRSDRRRAAWLAGRLAAKTAIARLGPSSSPLERIEILPAAGGEPVVRGATTASGVPIDVSIAHSEGLAVAIAFERTRTGAMGIDIEAGDQAIDPALVDFAFSPEEAAEIWSRADAGDRQRRLLRCWTAKEAVLKAVWRGLRLPLAAVRLTGTGADAPLSASVQYAPDASVPFDVMAIGCPGYVVSVAIEAAHAP